MTEELIKILAICIICTFLYLVIRPKSLDFAFAVTLAAGIVIIIWICKNIIEPIKEISEKIAEYGVETKYFTIALKAVGLAYITDFVSDACKDAGQISMANKAQLAGKTAIFILSVPIIISVLDTAIGFVK